MNLFQILLGELFYVHLHLTEYSLPQTEFGLDAIGKKLRKAFNLWDQVFINKIERYMYITLGKCFWVKYRNVAGTELEILFCNVGSHKRGCYNQMKINSNLCSHLYLIGLDSTSIGSLPMPF